MRRRADRVDQTRQQITEAAAHLHTTIGPAHTTISAIAEAAGVTRLTVYRHFKNDDELYAACSAHWLGLHPPPDPMAWQMIRELRPRVSHALRELYGWYSVNRDALSALARDTAAMPRSAQEQDRATAALIADALLQGIAVPDDRRRLSRAASGHYTAFSTWHSLVVDQGLDDGEAVELALASLVTVTGASAASSARGPSRRG